MMLLGCTIFICFILCLYYVYVILVFFIFCDDAIDKIYNSNDDVPLTQMLIQRNIRVSTEDKDMEEGEDDESYKSFVVMAEYLDDEYDQDLDYEDNVESKGKFVVT